MTLCSFITFLHISPLLESPSASSVTGCLHLWRTPYSSIRTTRTEARTIVSTSSLSNEYIPYVEYVFIALSVEYTLPELEMKQRWVIPSTIVVVNYGVDTICCISGLEIRVTNLLFVSLCVDMVFISWNGLKRRSQSEGFNLFSLLICVWSVINLFGLDETMGLVIFVPVYLFNCSKINCKGSGF